MQMAAPLLANRQPVMVLADSSYSNSGGFFRDYDRDGDLDVMLLNHGITKRVHIRWGVTISKKLLPVVQYRKW